MFAGGENGERFVVWDDGEAENMGEERKAWEALMVNLMITILRLLLTRM
jgi:hypothetical protein